MRPRLLIISATYASAENRKKLAALAPYFEVTCLTCRSARAFGVEFVAPEEAAPTPYQLTALPHWGDPGSSTRFLLRGLARALEKAQPEVVIVEQEPWAMVRWQAWLAARSLGRRVIFGEFSWENFARPGLKGVLLGLAYRLAIATTDLVISGNPLGGALWQGFGLPPAKLLVCPQMGIDPHRFFPCSAEEKRRLRQEWQIPAEAFVVGFAGRLTECKGVDQLTAAFGELRASRALPGARLCLLGGGNLKPGLEKLASEVDWLHLPPPVDHPQVGDFLRCLDVFVHASRPAMNARGDITFIEQSPYALGQAMLTGLPCIGGSTGAIVELMEGLEGLIPAGDAAALSAELVRVFRSTPAERFQRGAVNRARVLERWTNEIVAQRWAEAIRRTLETVAGA